MATISNSIKFINHKTQNHPLMSHLERAIYDKFHTLFPQMGYDVCIPQRQRGHTYTPDFVISSIDQKYKIAVEVKGSNHIYGNFFSYVSDMFARLQKNRFL